MRNFYTEHLALKNTKEEKKRYERINLLFSTRKLQCILLVTSCFIAPLQKDKLTWLLKIAHCRLRSTRHFQFIVPLDSWDMSGTTCAEYHTRLHLGSCWAVAIRSFHEAEILWYALSGFGRYAISSHCWFLQSLVEKQRNWNSMLANKNFLIARACLTRCWLLPLLQASPSLFISISGLSKIPSLLLHLWRERKSEKHELKFSVAVDTKITVKWEWNAFPEIEKWISNWLHHSQPNERSFHRNQYYLDFLEQTSCSRAWYMCAVLLICSDTSYYASKSVEGKLRFSRVFPTPKLIFFPPTQSRTRPFLAVCGVSLHRHVTLSFLLPGLLCPTFAPFMFANESTLNELSTQPPPQLNSDSESSTQWELLSCKHRAFHDIVAGVDFRFFALEKREELSSSQNTSKVERRQTFPRPTHTRPH